MKKAEREALRAKHMEMIEEMRKEIPFGDRIREGEKIEFFSLYEFDTVPELFNFLAVAGEYKCDVYFKNEDILCEADRSDSLLSMKITLYMSVKTMPEIAEAYTRYAQHCREVE